LKSLCTLNRRENQTFLSTFQGVHRHQRNLDDVDLDYVDLDNVDLDYRHLVHHRHLVNHGQIRWPGDWRRRKIRLFPTKTSFLLSKND
jgi:hypothetical protein